MELKTTLMPSYRQAYISIIDESGNENDIGTCNHCCLGTSIYYDAKLANNIANRFNIYEDLMEACLAFRSITDWSNNQQVGHALGLADYALVKATKANVKI